MANRKAFQDRQVVKEPVSPHAEVSSEHGEPSSRPLAHCVEGLYSSAASPVSCANAARSVTSAPEPAAAPPRGRGRLWLLLALAGFVAGGGYYAYITTKFMNKMMVINADPNR